MYGRFFIGNNYHALGQFIILKYLAQNETTLLRDKETYEKGKEQLDIIHFYNIILGDISQRDIFRLSWEAIFYGFWILRIHRRELGSNPASANPNRIKSDHRQLCSILGQPISKGYNQMKKVSVDNYIDIYMKSVVSIIDSEDRERRDIL